MSPIAPEDLLSLFTETAAAVTAALNALGDWGLAGTSPGQHHSDLAADRVATTALLEAGLGVCSEESGLQAADRSVVVVLDPVDGSTNAAQGIPWYATSFCAVDDLGALAALVVNLASGERYSATRGGGAYRDGRPIHPSAVADLSDAIIGLSGWSPRRPRWRQYRALGAAALDLCSVADGRLDGFADCHSHGPWDYLGGMLVCREAGAQVVDAAGRDLTTTDPRVRRTLLAAGNHSLLADLRGAWAG